MTVRVGEEDETTNHALKRNEDEHKAVPQRGVGDTFHYVIQAGKAGRHVSGCLAKSRPFSATWGAPFDCFPLPLQLLHAAT